MTQEFQFDLILPDRVLFSGSIVSLIVSTVKGEMTILLNHAPLISLLLPGIVTLNSLDLSQKRFFVMDGCIEVDSTHSIVVSTTAEDMIDVTEEYIDKKIQEIRFSLENKQDAASSHFLEQMNALINLKTAFLFNQELKHY